jgi:Tol biopolymer transport system component
LGENIGFQLSSDGKWVLTRTPESDRAYTLVPTGTGTPVPIELAGFDRVGIPRLFPDRKKILFPATEPGKTPRLYVQDLPKGKPRAITDRALGMPQSQPISPDGKWALAFGDWSEDLFLVPLDGGERRVIPKTKDLDPISWAPDGRTFFAFADGSIPARVFRVDVETGERALWKELVPPERSGLIAINPIFVTPDGRFYAYSYARSATSDLYLIEGLK